MLIEIPDLGAVLIIAALFFGGGFMLYLFSRLRSGRAPESVMPSSFDRLDYYEKQIIDMKIRLDSMDLDEPDFVEKSSLEKIEYELPKKPRRRNQESADLPNSKYELPRFRRTCVKINHTKTNDIT